MKQVKGPTGLYYANTLESAIRKANFNYPYGNPAAARPVPKQENLELLMDPRMQGLYLGAKETMAVSVENHHDMMRRHMAIKEAAIKHGIPESVVAAARDLFDAKEEERADAEAAKLSKEEASAKLGETEKYNPDGSRSLMHRALSAVTAGALDAAGGVAGGVATGVVAGVKSFFDAASSTASSSSGPSGSAGHRAQMMNEKIAEQTWKKELQDQMELTSRRLQDVAKEIPDKNLLREMMTEFFDKSQLKLLETLDDGFMRIMTQRRQDAIETMDTFKDEFQQLRDIMARAGQASMGNVLSQLDNDEFRRMRAELASNMDHLRTLLLSDSATRARAIDEIRRLADESRALTPAVSKILAEVEAGRQFKRDVLSQLLMLEQYRNQQDAQARAFNVELGRILDQSQQIGTGLAQVMASQNAQRTIARQSLLMLMDQVTQLQELHRGRSRDRSLSGRQLLALDDAKKLLEIEDGQLALEGGQLALEDGQLALGSGASSSRGRSPSRPRGGPQSFGPNPFQNDRYLGKFARGEQQRLRTAAYERAEAADRSGGSATIGALMRMLRR